MYQCIYPSDIGGIEMIVLGRKGFKNYWLWHSTDNTTEDKQLRSNTDIQRRQMVEVAAAEQFLWRIQYEALVLFLPECCVILKSLCNGHARGMDSDAKDIFHSGVAATCC